MNFSRIRILLLYASYKESRTMSYLDDWKDAFLRFPEFDAIPLNIARQGSRPLLRKTIGDFDLIVLLHSATQRTLQFVKPLVDVLNTRKGRLLTFVGDELNYPGVLLSEKLKLIREIRADFIGTQLPLAAGRWLYGDCEGSAVVPLPHALNPAAFRPIVPAVRRPIDIGARSVYYNPIYIGDDERNRLFDFFSSRRFDPPMRVDIVTLHAVATGRFDRKGWENFLNSCKGTIATEAGSYHLEKDDRTLQAIQRFLIEKQRRKGLKTISGDSFLQKAWSSLPAGIRPLSVKKAILKIFGILKIRHEHFISEGVEFEEIYEKFFLKYPGPRIFGKAISSRHFDAVGTKTCQIMFKGQFNGILNADEHYIGLEHDFANVEDAVRRFHEDTYRQSMVDRTYEYVMDEHTHAHRMRTIMEALAIRDNPIPVENCAGNENPHRLS